MLNLYDLHLLHSFETYHYILLSVGIKNQRMLFDGYATYKMDIREKNIIILDFIQFDYIGYTIEDLINTVREVNKNKLNNLTQNFTHGSGVVKFEMTYALYYSMVGAAQSGHTVFSYNEVDYMDYEKIVYVGGKTYYESDMREKLLYELKNYYVNQPITTTYDDIKDDANFTGLFKDTKYGIVLNKQVSLINKLNKHYVANYSIKAVELDGEKIKIKFNHAGDNYIILNYYNNYDMLVYYAEAYKEVKDFLDDFEYNLVLQQIAGYKIKTKHCGLVDTVNVGETYANTSCVGFTDTLLKTPYGAISMERYDPKKTKSCGVGFQDCTGIAYNINTGRLLKDSRVGRNSLVCKGLDNKLVLEPYDLYNCIVHDGTIEVNILCRAVINYSITSWLVVPLPLIPFSGIIVHGDTIKLHCRVGRLKISIPMFEKMVYHADIDRMLHFSGKFKPIDLEMLLNTKNKLNIVSLNSKRLLGKVITPNRLQNSLLREVD